MGWSFIVGGNTMTEKKNKFIDLKGANSTMKLGLAIYAAMVIAFVLGACFLDLVSCRYCRNGFPIILA